MQLKEIYIHPLKSGRGQQVDAVQIEALGPRHDRRWMLCDENGRFLSARNYPRMVLIESQVDEKGICFSAPGADPLRVEMADMTEPLPVSVWKHAFSAFAGYPEADFWFSEWLGTSCRLAYTDDRTARRTTADPTSPVGFADGYPVLLIGSASLADLNARLVQPVSMRHFRPNLVIETTEPYIEDRIAQVRIGDVVFDHVKRCARCVLTTVDPDSGIPDADMQPLATLNDYRSADDGTCFGINLIPRALGELVHGAPVEILSWRA
ncbi:MOSC domain-containing protein [Burkholderiaceae bacterium DAT-1]|nr:MOSC domain-containing protein [Burkholderiaceae bacterium DAT-1]